MKWWLAYKAYINDNPQGYWFRRKLFGWGWTPATHQGWLVLGCFLIFTVGVAIRAERLALSDKDVFTQVLLPVVVAMAILIYICFKTGEAPKWQWRIPKKYYQD